MCTITFHHPFPRAFAVSSLSDTASVHPADGDIQPASPAPLYVAATLALLFANNRIIPCTRSSYGIAHALVHGYDPSCLPYIPR